MHRSPGIDDVVAASVPFALPLRRRFRGVEVREGVLIEGPSGWGEFAPFDDYSTPAAARWLASALEAAYGSWPAPLRPQVAVNAIVPEVDAASADELTRAAVREHGCRTIKVKVGSVLLADDETRVGAVRGALDALLGPGVGAIRIDANGAWSHDAAVEALRVLTAFGLEYVEQPCRESDDLRRLRTRVDIPIAVDESIRQAAGPVTSVADLADVAVLKAAPLGGVAATLRQAEVLDVPVVLSGSLDSSVGIATSLAAAAALPTLDLACGLGTGALLAADLCAPLVPRDGVLQVLRPEPDAGLLDAARQRLGTERREFWHRRLADAWAALERERLLP